MKNFLFVVFITCSVSLFGQSIHYTVQMSRPQNHYFEVEMEVSGFKGKEMVVKMPVWAPGSYLVREFAKNVNQVLAYDEMDKTLPIVKTTKNAWKITTNKAKKVRVVYQVYAFELSVRTSFLDMTHGFISSSGVFMYLDGAKDKSGSVTVVPHPSFKVISTALAKKPEEFASDGAKTFVFSNYDELADSPIEVGNQLVFDFSVGETKHTVAMYGEGNFDVDELKADMAKIVKSANHVFGGVNPNKEYLFIIHNVLDGQGGLEHSNSCVLSVNRWTYGSDYKDFLGLVAHEYFHLWNVKRIRPIELGPFNYDAENYTTLLWVSEGFTSYYEKLIPLRAGILSKDEFVSKVMSGMNYVESSVGSRVQPVAMASYDAWIKAYRPNENSANTTMSYYSRGMVLAAYLDAFIIEKFNGEKCLDDFMTSLYNEFYLGKKRGFTEAEFQSSLEKFVGQDMGFFFDNYVRGTEIPNYSEVFSKIGLKIKQEWIETASFGATTSANIVRSIRAGSAAEDAGLSVGDEILAIDNVRCSNSDIQSYMSSMDAGETCEILISRDEILMTLSFKMTSYKRPSFAVESADLNNKKLLYWLREDK